MNPCVEFCYVRYGKQYSHNCDAECDYAKAILENKELKKKIAAMSEKHGQWISEGTGYAWCYICSECGWKDGYPFEDRHRFCPNCGIKMDVKD